MEQITFDKLQLKTVFACVACDGRVDQQEIDFIKRLYSDSQLFGIENFNEQIQEIILDIQTEGQGFLKSYIEEFEVIKLTEKEELKLIEVAITAIEADEMVEYSEIKFFKLIRSKLRITNEKILEKHPHFENYLEEDIIEKPYNEKKIEDYTILNSIKEFINTHNFLEEEK